MVSAQSHAQALLEFPDPRMVLGPLYDGDAFGLSGVCYPADDEER